MIEILITIILIIVLVVYFFSKSGLNNQTATIYHDGIAQETIDLGSNLTIGALQFKAQNFDVGSIGQIGSLKFIQLNSDSTNSSGTITVDASERLQKIEGFGASGAWYETSLNNHNDRNEIINKAFVELGLDIFRGVVSS